MWDPSSHYFERVFDNEKIKDNIAAIARQYGRYEDENYFVTIKYPPINPTLTFSEKIGIFGPEWMIVYGTSEIEAHLHCSIYKWIHIEKIDIYGGYAPLPKIKAGTWLVKLSLHILNALGVATVSIYDESTINYRGVDIRLPIIRLFQCKQASWYQSLGFVPNDEKLVLSLENQIRSLSTSEISLLYNYTENTIGEYMNRLLRENINMFNSQLDSWYDNDKSKIHRLLCDLENNISSMIYYF